MLLQVLIADIALMVVRIQKISSITSDGIPFFESGI